MEILSDNITLTVNQIFEINRVLGFSPVVYETPILKDILLYLASFIILFIIIMCILKYNGFVKANWFFSLYREEKDEKNN